MHGERGVTDERDAESHLVDGRASHLHQAPGIGSRVVVAHCPDDWPSRSPRNRDHAVHDLEAVIVRNGDEDDVTDVELGNRLALRYGDAAGREPRAHASGEHRPDLPLPTCHAEREKSE